MTPKRKTTIIGLVMLLFVINCNAQDSKHTAGIVVERMNVLYAGIPNPVTIVSSVPPQKLRISWGGAIVTSLGGGRYDVYVPDTLRFITISVSAELKKGKIVNLGSTTYRIKTVPPPNVFVSGHLLSGGYEKELILSNPLIAAKMGTDFNYDLRWTVVSYKVTFLCDKDEPIIVNGPKFGDRVIEKIQNAPSGTIVVFSDFKIQSIMGKFDIEEQVIITIK